MNKNIPRYTINPQYRFRILSSYEHLCSRCSGTGFKPSTATTITEICNTCNGKGIVTAY